MKKELMEVIVEVAVVGIGLLLVILIIGGCSDASSFTVTGDHVTITGEVNGIQASEAKAVIQADVDDIEKK